MICWLLSAIALTSKAQNYQLLNRGEPMPYKGVAVRLETYRKESEYIKLTDSLLISYKKQVLSYDAILEANQKVIDQQKQSLALQSSLLANKEQTAQQLSKGLQEIKEQLPKQRWFESPLFLAGVGVVVGIVIAK